MQQPDFLDIKHPEQYNLLVRITPDKFIFCIYEPDKRENVSYQEIAFPMRADELVSLEDNILDSVFLTLSYRLVNVIFVSKDYDLIPQYMIQKDKKEILYNFTHFQPAKKILYSPVSVQQVVTVYNTEENLHQFLARNLYQAEFHHHSNILMQYLERKNKELPPTAKMYLNFHDEFVDVFCYDKLQRILHVLTFQGENQRNMIYHILNLWDKCGFDQHNDYIYILSGYGNPDLYVTSMLGEYVKNVRRLAVVNDIETFRTLDFQTALPLDMLIQSAQ